MPTPGSSYFTPNVAPTAAPVPRVGQVSPSAFGADLAESVGRTALVAGEIQDRVQEDHWTAVVLDYDNQLSAWQSEATTAALATRGKDAQGVTARRLAEYDRMVRDQTQLIKHPRAQQAFAIRAQRRRTEIEGDFGNHEQRETETYLQDTAEAHQELAVSSAYRNAENPDRLAEGYAVGLKAVALANRGASPEVLTAKRQAFDESFHAAVVVSHVNAERLDAAREYFKAHEAELAGSATGERVRRELKSADFRARGQREEDRIVGAFPGNYERQLESARRIENPELRDLVIARLDARKAQDDEAEAQGYSDLVSSAEEHFKRSWSHRAIPNAVWAKLRLREQNAFLKLEARRAAPAGGADPEFTPEIAQKWYAWKQAAPAERARTNLFLEFYGRVPRTMYTGMVEEQQTLLDAQRGLQSSGRPYDVPDPKLTEVQSVDEQIRTTARTNKIIPWAGDLEASQAQDMARLTTAFQRELQAFELGELKGQRKASPQERQAILDRLMLPVRAPAGTSMARTAVSRLVTPFGFPSFAQKYSNVPAFKAAEAPAQPAAAPAGVSPASPGLTDDEITAAFVSRGKTVTPAKVARLREAYARGDRAAVRALLEQP